MATANTVFIIYDTAGVPIAAIQPSTLNGPGGVQQSSDLSMFGQGYALWGAASDQNDYRLLEHFACPQSVLNPTPVQPMGTEELGTGNGINFPVVGQIWFNTTTQSLYVYTSTGWTVASISVVSTTQPSNPSVGQLWYNTTIPQLEVWNGTAWVSVAALYLPLAGGTMAGAINMDGQNITGANYVTANIVSSTALTAPNGNPSNEITIPNSGATTLADGPRIGSYIIYHTGNLTITPAFVQGMIMMWNSPTPPSGWALCNGGTYTGFGPLLSVTTPDLRNLFIVGAGSTYSVGSTGGALTGTATTSSYTHAHGGATGGTVLTIANLPAHTHNVYGVGAVLEFTSGSATIFPDISGGTGAYYTNQSGGAGAQMIENTGSGTAHTHTIASDTHTHTVTVSTVPPYYGLYYIMKL